MLRSTKEQELKESVRTRAEDLGLGRRRGASQRLIMSRESVILDGL